MEFPELMGFLVNASNQLLQDVYHGRKSWETWTRFTNLKARFEKNPTPDLLNELTALLLEPSPAYVQAKLDLVASCQ